MAKDTKQPAATTDTPDQAPAPDHGIPTQPPQGPAPKPAAPAAKLNLVPEADKRNDPAATRLLLEACEKFGVNPTADCRPPELKGWRFYPGDSVDGIPDAVSLVTAGGLKIRHFADPTYHAPGCLEPAMDLDTEDRLRRLFGAFTVDPKTKDVSPAPFPPDLTLPASAVDGRVRSTDHVYRGGYLKAGGKEAAAKRGR